MQLYYSGSRQPNQPQPESSKSLGGFVSSSPLPNGRINNLFPNIAKSTVLNTGSDIRLFVLKNTSGVVVNAVRIYSNVSGSHIKLRLAAVAPAVDNCGNTIFESVQDGKSLPYQATLEYCEGIDDAIDVSTLDIGAYIGVWVQREIDPTAFPSLLGVDPAISPQDLAVLIKTQTIVSEEAIQLIINWT